MLSQSDEETSHEDTEGICEDETEYSENEFLCAFCLNVGKGENWHIKNVQL